VPKGVTGKKWKPPFAGWPRKARAVVRDLESSFSPERQVSCQVRPLAAPNWTTAPGQEATYGLRKTWEFECLVADHKPAARTVVHQFDHRPKGAFGFLRLLNLPAALVRIEVVPPSDMKPFDLRCNKKCIVD